MCRVLHAPGNVALISKIRGTLPPKPWLEPFQIVYPPERSEDEPPETVRASFPLFHHCLCRGV